MHCERRALTVSAARPGAFVTCFRRDHLLPFVTQTSQPLRITPGMNTFIKAEGSNAQQRSDHRPGTSTVVGIRIQTEPSTVLLRDYGTGALCARRHGRRQRRGILARASAPRWYVRLPDRAGRRSLPRGRWGVRQTASRAAPHRARSTALAIPVRSRILPRVLPRPLPLGFMLFRALWLQLPGCRTLGLRGV